MCAWITHRPGEITIELLYETSEGSAGQSQAIAPAPL
jgi:hypothetical protein